MFDITSILEGIIGIIMMVITYYVLPILESKKKNSKVVEAYNTINSVINIATIAVDAVEQMNKKEKLSSDDKLNSAMIYAKEMLNKYGITYNELELRAAIEQSVKKMNAAVATVLAPAPTVTEVVEVAEKAQ